MKVTKIMLYTYQLEIIEDNKFSLGKHEKLPNTDNKKIQTPL